VSGITNGERDLEGEIQTRFSKQTRVRLLETQRTVDIWISASRKGSEMLHLASSFVVLLLGVGLWLRHRVRSLHLRLMISAFVLDVRLVIYIEISRHSVEKVVTGISPMIWFHAEFRGVPLLCYVAMILLGGGILSGRGALRELASQCGSDLRGFTKPEYVTSYMVV